MRARSAWSAGLSRPNIRPASVPRAARIASSTVRPCAVSWTRVARRSLGSGCRSIRPRDSRASATSVAERGAMRSFPDSRDSRSGPCRPSTRSARRWAGVMSHGASVSWDVSRSWRATAQNTSASVSSPVTSRPPRSAPPGSPVTGIAYQHFAL
ncbi:MAG TPA: hypothetical protein VMH35_26620 [Streptosporangiaceae bacterium]|nr:hypothetical protein [Streptosporangiaceae bacterium]